MTTHTKPRIRVHAGRHDVPNLAPLGVQPLMNKDVTPSVVLAGAAGENLISALVCGQNADGDFVMWATCASNADALMLVERARDMILRNEREAGAPPRTGGEVVPFSRPK